MFHDHNHENADNEIPFDVANMRHDKITVVIGLKNAPRTDPKTYADWEKACASVLPVLAVNPSWTWAMAVAFLRGNAVNGTGNPFLSGDIPPLTKIVGDDQSDVLDYLESGD